jgi:hypothetical protein
VLEHRLPDAWHRTERYANNRIEADHPIPPACAYRRSHACTVCRTTPNRRATSVTATPSRTSRTASYRCSTTPSSTSTTAGPLNPWQPTATAKRPRSAQLGSSIGVSPTYRNRCRTPTGTASTTCRPGTGTNVSSIYRARTHPHKA